MPGFGSRPAGDDDLRPVALAARLAAGWLADDSTSTILMGHSASCQIVAHAARLVPQKVSGLVLVGPTTDPRAAAWPRIAERWVGTPALVARGRHDRICPEDWAHELVGAAPAGSRAVTLEKGAHMVPLTHGDLLAAAVTAAVG